MYIRMIVPLLRPDALQSLLPPDPSLSLELFLKPTLHVPISVRLLLYRSWCFSLPSIVPDLYCLQEGFPGCTSWNESFSCVAVKISGTEIVFLPQRCQMLKARIEPCSLLWFSGNYHRPGFWICLTIWDSKKIIHCMYSTSGPSFSCIRVEWLRKIIIVVVLL